MKLPQLFLTLLLSAAVAFGVVKYAAPTAQTASARETAYEHVMKTGILRCGYVVIPPQLARDPQTGAISGISADFIAEVAKRLDLKIEWTQEASFATIPEDLKAGRYDALCLTAYRWPPTLRAMDYTTPVYYSTTDVYVRADDTRFDTDLSMINDPAIKVATIDGEAAEAIRAQDFPKAGTFAMPQSTDISFLFEAVDTKKADVAFAHPLMVAPYLLAHPGTLRRLKGPKPLRIHSHAFGFAKGEHDLVSMFNVVLDNMLQDGTTDAILDKYEAIPDSFVRLKKVME